MNLLLIMPRFYNYHKELVNILSFRYDKVIFRSEVPLHYPVVYYGIKQLSGGIADRILKCYNESLIEAVIQYKIEKIFIIRGYGLKTLFFERLAKIPWKVEIINYQWDSIENNQNGLLISKYSHANYSFDYQDTLKYNIFSYLPLFYSWQEKSEAIKLKRHIDILFVGFLHSSRLKIVKEVEEICSKTDLNFKYLLYYPFFSYVKDFMRNSAVPLKYITFKKISSSHYYDLMICSESVLDIHNPKQSGATIRTIEALSLNKKVISTNFNLLNEFFYAPDNIMILNDKITHQTLRHFINGKFDNSSKSKLLSMEEWVSSMHL